ncbi:Cof-type HAD-IIB family hydrolase [Dellaglioa sp. P0083]|uniref:Cof-type HAD-IIB family hydrolase n=1 Tax=Dellaglioa kimchii TaxID=3344667 RepID=UPI0038D42093
MTIKLIAVDLDGTFLRDDKSYDKERFSHQFERMQQQGIHFVVASGNPTLAIEQYFKEIKDKIGYVAENGAVIQDAKELLKEYIFENSLYQETIQYLKETFTETGLLAVNNQGGFYDKRESDTFIQDVNDYYPKVTGVDNLVSLNQGISMLTGHFPVSLYERISLQLNTEMNNKLQAKASGFGYIDINLVNATKKNGINLLQNRWHILDEEVATFGDNDNDQEMLAFTPNSFSMASGSRLAKKTAKHIIGLNQNDSVLDSIDDILNHKL